MVSLFFLLIIVMSFWTLLTLFRKGPNDSAIKSNLAELGSIFLSLINIFLKLYESFKSLFFLLNDSNDNNESIKSVKESKVITPNLIKLNEKTNNKNVA